jgi:hypothetical protein
MRTPDLSLQYKGAPCYRGHSGMRYRRGGRCVECAQILSRDRSAMLSDMNAATRPGRRDEFKAAIERAVAHMYAAGMALWTAKNQGVRGWRQELARHGLTQRTAAELRRYVLRVDEERRSKAAPGTDSADWLKE